MTPARYSLVVHALVARLLVSPVKGLVPRPVAAVTLDRRGVVEDRRFCLVNAVGRVLYGGDLGPLVGASAICEGDAIAIDFGDGETCRSEIAIGEAFVARGYADKAVPGHIVDGPIAAALSRRLPVPVRLLHVAPGVALPGPVTLIGSASLARLASALGHRSVDPRRFRMNVEIDGLEPHGEDGLAGAILEVGSAELAVGAPVPRCVLTTRHPETFAADLDVPAAILSYRRPLMGGKAPFGVYAEVVRPGRVAVGDPVSPR